MKLILLCLIVLFLITLFGCASSNVEFPFKLTLHPITNVSPTSVKNKITFQPPQTKETKVDKEEFINKGHDPEYFVKYFSNKTKKEVIQQLSKPTYDKKSHFVYRLPKGCFHTKYVYKIFFEQDLVTSISYQTQQLGHNSGSGCGK